MPARAPEAAVAQTSVEAATAATAHTAAASSNVAPGRTSQPYSGVIGRMAGAREEVGGPRPSTALRLSLQSSPSSGGGGASPASSAFSSLVVKAGIPYSDMMALAPCIVGYYNGAPCALICPNQASRMPIAFRPQTRNSWCSGVSGLAMYHSAINHTETLNGLVKEDGKNLMFAHLINLRFWQHWMDTQRSNDLTEVGCLPRTFRTWETYLHYMLRRVPLSAHPDKAQAKGSTTRNSCF